MCTEWIHRYDIVIIQWNPQNPDEDSCVTECIRPCLQVAPKCRQTPATQTDVAIFQAVWHAIRKWWQFLNIRTCDKGYGELPRNSQAPPRSRKTVETVMSQSVFFSIAHWFHCVGIHQERFFRYGLTLILARIKITSIMNCKMKLHIHSQNWMVPPFKFGNSMRLLISAGIKVSPY